MTIDDKLRDILDSLINAGSGDLNDFIAQIKQAFADEGYLPHVDSGKHVKVGDKLYITNGSDPLVKVDLAEYMTGQTWFDRFKEELDSGLKLPEVMDIWVRKCAEIASGIKE